MHNKVPKNEYLKGKPGKKQNPYKKDVIYDPRGQWDYPGEVTKIPSGTITMQGVPYPVLGVDNLGYEQMMYPGLDYQFPGDTVTEYPMFQKGGQREPVYVNSVTDPRYQMYSDSLNLYKAYQYQKQHAGDLGQRTYNKPNYYQGIQQRSTPRYVPSLGRTMKDTYDTPSQVESAYPGHNNRNIIEYYKSLPFNYPTLIGLYDSPDIGHSKIKPIGEYRDKYSLSPIYKKPVQPVVVGTAPAPEPVKQPKPIVVFDPEDLRLQAYNDSLNLYNDYLDEVKGKKLKQFERPQIYDMVIETGRIINGIPEVRTERRHNLQPWLKDPIRPIGIQWIEDPIKASPVITQRGVIIGTQISPISGIPKYKKPVQPVVYQKPEEPKPAPAPAPVPTEPSTKYAYMPTNWGPTYYYEWDAQQKKWIPISQQSYNYNTEGGTKNTQLYSSTPPGFKYGGDPSIPELNQAKKGGWLNKYSKMPKKTSSKNIKTSINKLMVKNPLFERNYMLYGAKGPRLYDPSSKYQAGGTSTIMWTIKDVGEEYWNKFIKKYPGAIGINPYKVDKNNQHMPVYPTPKPVLVKTPEQKARELKPIESKLTPMEVAPEPALYKAPTRQPLYKKTQAPNLPPFYWKYDSTAKQWYQISEREYNNAPAEQKKTGENTGWLDSYQGGGQNKPSASQEWIANNPGYLPSSMVTIIGEDNKPKQVRLDSQEYSDYWNKHSGKILQPYTTTPTEDNPEGIMYQAPTMQTQTVTDKATGSGKHVLDFEKKEGTLEEWKAKQKETAWDRMMKNMKNVSYEDYLNQRDARLTSMYEDKKNNYVAGKILKDKPKGNKSRADWNQSFTPAERYFIDNSNKANKIKPNIFQTTAAGISRLNMPQIPGLNPFDKAIGLTPEESKNISGANALDILSYPTNVAWGALYDPEMSFGDALSGQQTDKIPLGMQIAGDPLNLLGIGLVDEGADVLKGVSKARTSNVGYKFPKYPLQSSKTQVGIDPVHYRAVDAVKNNSSYRWNYYTGEFESGRPRSSILVNPQFGHDYVLPEGMGVDELNSFTQRAQNGFVESNQIDDVYESLIKLNPELKNTNVNKLDLIGGVSSHIAPQDLVNIKNLPPIGFSDPSKGFFGNLKAGYQEAKWKQFTDENEGFDFRFSPERQKEIMRTYKPTNTPTQLPGSSNVAPVVNPTPTPWSMQEMPGLHLKSTMLDGPVSKIVEPKTGLVNVEQALAIIGKESGGSDKVALIKQGMGENIPKKMDFNEFRKTVQDQLIPLERQFSTARSNYGLEAIGYYGKPFFDDYNNVYRVHGAKDLSFKTQEEALSFISKNKPLENQTLILGNKSKFGRGSHAHGNPDETLGHIHFLRDAETPDVLTVTQIQSDAFQGTHRAMPKSKEAAEFSYRKGLEHQENLKNIYKNAKPKIESGLDLDGNPYWYELPDGTVIHKDAYFEGIHGQQKLNDLQKAEIENFTQKQLLDKNHQERYLQELVDYAGKRGDVNKVRVPTSETAAKVQGYKKSIPTELDDNLQPVGGGKYSSEHQTILKKYEQQPKTIKKLFGEEPKIVTDSKGNTWYEFNIPKKFKKGKGEIKALKYGGWLDTYQNGGTPIHYTSEAQYRAGLLNKNKSAEQIAAEREWVAKRAAAQKAQSTPKPTYGPTPDQQAALFGMKSLPSETSQRSVMPAKTAEIKAQEQKVFDTQVKQKMKDNPNWDRQKAVSAVNVERAYQGPGVIKEAQPEQGIISKTIEVAANPFNALDAYVQSGYVPDYFSQSKDAVNPLNTVYQMATPAGWYTTGAQALYNKLPKDVEQGNWLGVGEDILMGIPLAGKIGSKALNFTANRVANTPKVNFRTGNIEVYNPETGMYDMYNVSLPNQIVPGRPYQDVAPKMKSLRKDLGISYPEHLANKYIPGFAREIPLEQGKGIVIDPVSGRLFDSNTRYWLNREYGITPKIDPLLSERASFIAKNYGTKISESATPINKSGITYGAPNPALGNPIGTTDDIRRSLIPESEYLFPSEYSKRGVPFSSFRPEAGGYTDIPQFNQQVQNFNTQMQFGKRPLETQINVRPETQKLLGEMAFLESQGDLSQYYYNTPVYPGFSTLERRPLTGYQMFQQIQPNKYGGTPRKSGKKLVNYTQKPNFVKTQSTSWLDKYK